MFALGVACSSRPAWGDSKASFPIAYVAPAGCPPESAFLEKLRERTPNVTSSAPGAAQLTVTAEHTDDSYVVRVELRTLEPSQPRVLRGATCDEALAAAAMVIALAIDSQEEWQLPPDESSQAPVDSEVEATSPRLLTPARVRSIPAPPEPPAPEPPSPPTTAHPPGPRFRAGGQYLYSSAYSPDPASVAAVFGEIGDRQRAWSGRLAFVYADSGYLDLAEHQARFWAVGGRLDGCWSPTERPRLPLCVAVEFGRAAARIRAPEYRLSGLSTERGWFAAGPLLRLVQDVITPVDLELEVGLFFPSDRNVPFFRKAELQVHDIPTLAWHAGIGLGLEIN